MLKNIIVHRPNLKLQFKINKNLIQSFKVLQMSLQEMHEFAKKEIEINPVLSMSNIGKNNNSNQLIEKYAEKPNIKNWLYQQSYTLFEKKDRGLVKIYIENLDDNGFCRISAKEVANFTSSSITNAKKVLQKLKSLDPIGIFSQSLEENACFLVRWASELYGEWAHWLRDLIQDIKSGYKTNTGRIVCKIEEMIDNNEIEH